MIWKCSEEESKWIESLLEESGIGYRMREQSGLLVFVVELTGHSDIQITYNTHSLFFQFIVNSKVCYKYNSNATWKDILGLVERIPTIIKLEQDQLAGGEYG